MQMMGKLFCLSVFGRKTKDSKAGLCSDIPQNNQGLNVTTTKTFSGYIGKDVNDLKLSYEDGVISQEPSDSPSSFSDSVHQLQTQKPIETGALKTVSEKDQFKVMGVEAEGLKCATSTTPTPVPNKDNVYSSNDRSEGHSSILQNIDENLGTDSSDECADESGSEASEPHSVRHMSEDCCIQLGDESMRNPSLDVETNFYAKSNKVQRDGEYAQDDLALHTYTPHTDDAIGANCSPDKGRLSSERMACEEELLSGHLSDPGVYQREEVQSLNGSPNLQREHSPVRSSVVEGSFSSRNHDSRSYASKSLESVSVECLSGQTANVNVTTPDRSDVSAGHGAFNGASAQVKRVDHEDILESQVSSPQQNFRCAINDVKHDIFETIDRKSEYAEPALADVCPEIGEYGTVTMVGLELASSTSNFPFPESTFTRVEQWINTIQQPSFPVFEEEASTSNEQGGEVVANIPPIVPTTDRELSNTVVQTLNPFSTVAHMGGIGLREVPQLGVFSCLKSLNLSANSITQIPSGCFPQTLHSLDLSRNRISQIEGFRDLTRLRVLNLSYNKISRIGHGLANCTLIKELHLVGNKIAEVEGLHRLLKLTVLDLSHNKIATSKALGQLAANYSSLLALNLLGNPILMNVGEDQVRKLVTSLAPHVTYLNKQPIKTVSVREAVIDSVARAALGTSQRGNKFGGGRSSRRVTGSQPSSVASKKISHRAKDFDRKAGSSSEHSKSAKGSRHHHHHNRHRLTDSGSGQSNEKGHMENRRSVKTPLRDHLLRNLALDTTSQAMHRSRSDSALQDE